jgi:hypothetical protein
MTDIKYTTYTRIHSNTQQTHHTRQIPTLQTLKYTKTLNKNN